MVFANLFSAAVVGFASGVEAEVDGASETVFSTDVVVGL